MRKFLLSLLLLAAPALADEPPTISYRKSVMLDPEYKSAWSGERIAEALKPPPPRVVVEYVEVERQVPVYTEPRYDWGGSWDVGLRHDYGWRHRQYGRYGRYGYHRYRYPSFGFGYSRHYPYRSTFPGFTILGGAAGGIIGHQSRETAAGIAIGAGVGFLADILTSR